MARSKYIYIVLNGAYIEAAFTVKHELESWLADKDFYDNEEMKSVWGIFRIGDNSDDEPIDITDEIINNHERPIQRFV